MSAGIINHNKPLIRKNRNPATPKRLSQRRTGFFDSSVCSIICLFNYFRLLKITFCVRLFNRFGQTMKNALLTIILLFGTALCAPLARAQSAAPSEKNKREAHLIELIKLDNSIKLDVRYARADNFVGRPVYPEARAFLQKPAAKAVVRVHRELKKMGYGLVIFDGYRPWRITKLFWEVTPEEKRIFVANPAKGSKHNRGCAVDLSIYDLKTGKLLDMPSDFDEFSERASPVYTGAAAEQIKNRELLRRLMEAAGFTVNANEWWHFDYKDWQDYAIYDIPFSEIKEE